MYMCVYIYIYIIHTLIYTCNICLHTFIHANVYMALMFTCMITPGRQQTLDWIAEGPAQPDGAQVRAPAGPRAAAHAERPGVARGDDTVGKPRRAQISQFELFELFHLLKLDDKCFFKRVEPTVSQSTVSSPLVEGWVTP